MDVKCFNVEVINYKDSEGKEHTLYKVWFSLTTGVGWLITSKPTKSGDVVQLDIVPMNTQDVKTNMRLGIRIV